MKIIKFVAMMLMAATMSFGMTACGDDDETKDIIDGFGDGDVDATAVYTVTKSKLEIEYTCFAYTSVETATFDGEKCTSWKTVQTYSSTALADKAWELISELGEDDELGLTDCYSKDGKKITIDQGKIGGLSYETYETMKLYFDQIVAGYEKNGVKVTRK